MTDHTVADLGEHAIIEKVRSRVPAVSAEVKLGIGDDAAILQPDRNTLTVVTTDVLVEGVHFDRAFTPMDAVGHKALAISLSDVAAMGGVPRHALISLALPQSLVVSDLDLLLDGLLGLGTRASRRCRGRQRHSLAALAVRRGHPDRQRQAAPHPDTTGCAAW